VPEGVFGERRRLVFGSVIREELIGRELNRLSTLFAGFLLDDLTVASL
jgi:hypothetical protein